MIENEDIIADNLIKKCKENGYHKQLVMDIVGIAATCEDMDSMLIKFTELCDDRLSETDFFTKVMQIAGLED